MNEDNQKYKIEKDTVQETLLLPLIARKIGMEKFPNQFEDIYCKQILDKLDYAMPSKKVPDFALLEGLARQYDLCEVIRDYLKIHPKACVVNMGCGLDPTFRLVDNGQCIGYNIDQPDVIAIRNKLLSVSSDREHNIASDLSDVSWFDKIDFKVENGIVLVAGGVFYYFKKDEVKSLLTKLATHFKGGKIAFDSTNQRGMKLMIKHVFKDMAKMNVEAYFYSDKPVAELALWHDFKSVKQMGYMTGYLTPDKSWGVFNRLLSYVSDKMNLTQIIEIEF